jgi:hypothetical protein
VIVACGEGALCITELRNPAASACPPPSSCAACRSPRAADSTENVRPIEFSAAGII